jgi:signal peptidase I
MQRLYQLQDDARHSMAEEILCRTGSLRMRVLGESMLPSIWPGDVLLITRQNVEQFVIGDIGLFRRDGRFFVHRIQKIVRIDDSLHFVGRGDSVPKADPPFLSTELLGRVVEIHRNNQTRVPVCPLPLHTRAAGWMLSHCNSLRRLCLSGNGASRGNGFGRAELRPWEPAASSTQS